MSARSQSFSLAVRGIVMLGLALSIASQAQAMRLETVESEETQYRSFFASVQSVSIPEKAVNSAGSAVVHFPMAQGRGISLELDLRTAGPGTYTLNLAAMPSIVVPTLDGRGRKIETAELAQALAVTDSMQNVFCRRTDGLGGAVAFAEIPSITATGESVTIAAMISNDGLAHADQEVLATCNGGTVDAGTGDLAGETKGDRVWCISWFSSMCFDNGPRMRRCDFEACDVTMASLVNLASAAGVTIPPLLNLPGAIDWLSRKLGLSIGGYCSKVYLLGIVSVGCQCVLHTF